MKNIEDLRATRRSCKYLRPLPVHELDDVRRYSAVVQPAIRYGTPFSMVIFYRRISVDLMLPLGGLRVIKRFCFNPTKKVGPAL